MQIDENRAGFCGLMTICEVKTTTYAGIAAGEL